MSGKPLSARDKRIFGCLLGCCAIVLVCILVAGGGAYYMLKFGSFKSAPRVDTAVGITTPPALLLHIDLQSPGAFSLAMLDNPGMSGYNGNLLRMFIPYEGTFTANASPDSPDAEFGAALSMPRMAEYIVGKLRDAKPALESSGRKITTLETQGELKGLALLRGTMPLPSEAAALRTEAWPTPKEGQAPTLEHNHFVEATLDNRNGQGAVALAALVQTLGAEEASAPFAPTPIAEPNPAAGEPLSLLAQVRIIKGLKFIKTAHISGDFTPKGDLDVHLSVSGADEVSAMFLMAGLGPLPEHINKVTAENGVTVSGDIARNGSEISGSLHFDGIAKAIRKALDARGAGPNREPPAWLLKKFNPPMPQAAAAAH